MNNRFSAAMNHAWPALPLDEWAEPGVLYGGGTPAELEAHIASREELDCVTLCDEYARRRQDYLR